MLRVLLDSMTPETFEQIRRGIPEDRYELMSTNEIRGFEEVVRARHPHIAVLGRIHEKQDEAYRKIESLKATWDGVRIIVISEASSIKDASIIEQGVFFYMTSTNSSILIRIIEAAAIEIGRVEKRRLQSIERESFNA